MTVSVHEIFGIYEKSIFQSETNTFNVGREYISHHQQRQQRQSKLISSFRHYIDVARNW